MVNVFIGLGANKGDRKKNILRAIELLKGNGQKILKTSSIIETEPYGYKRQRKFLNTVVKIKTKLSPERLLKLCKKIEKKIGRKKSFRWGPREIDLDILFYGNKIVKKRNLIIPHPEFHKREFVLKSFKEIAPNFIHPVFKRKVKIL